MLATLLSYVPASLLFVLLGLVVYVKERSNKTYQAFANFCYAFAIWLAFLCGGDLSQNPQVSVWFVRFGSIAGTAVMPLFMYFCTLFPRRSGRRSAQILKVSWVIASFFILVSPTPYLIPSVSLTDGSAQPTNLNLLYVVQSMYLLVGYLLAVFFLISKYRSGGSIEKKQIRIVAGGMLLAVLVNISTGFILTYFRLSGAWSNAAGSVSLLLFAAMTAYALVRYKMFNLRPSIVRTVAYTITIVLASGLFTVGLLIMGSLFSSDLHTALQSKMVLAELVFMMLVIGLTFTPLRLAIRTLTEKIFLQGTYDTRTVLEKLSSILITSKDLDQLIHKSTHLLTETLHPTVYALIVWDGSRIYRSFDTGNVIDELGGERVLRKAANELKTNQPVVLAQKTETDVFTSPSGVHIEIGMNIGDNNRLTATFLLGEKKSGQSYTNEDISLLRISAVNLGIAIEDALKYEQITQFAETLKAEVKKATRKLQVANDELHALSVAKDEFMSMATHQIRPQLTAVRGFIEIMQQSSQDEEQDELLEMSNTGVERSMRIIADMLNLSRFSTGTLSIDKRSLDLVQMIEHEQRALMPLAKTALVDVTNSTTIKKAMAKVDEVKLREVIANLCHNAIQYSPQNSTIDMRLEAVESGWQFEVRDHGIGVKREEEERLFAKFYRADSAKDKRPAGTGVGLFLAKTVVEAHGGRVYYRRPSDGDGGSIFGFWIPTV